MSALKISDLSIGDWVMYGGRPKKIDVIDLYKNNADDPRVGFLVHKQSNGWHRVHYHNIEDFEPIPITPEILEASGMEFIEMDEEDGYALYGDSCVTVSAKYSSNLYSVALPRFSGVVRFVHQLQHALRLAGINKEIEMPNMRSKNKTTNIVKL